jgi:hypothetical protein
VESVLVIWKKIPWMDGVVRTRAAACFTGPRR